MRFPALILLAAVASRALQTPPPSDRREWIDPATGHRVIRLSDDPGSATLYFHDNAFSAAGDRMMLQTPKGMAVIDVARIGGAETGIEMVAPEARGGYFARRGRDIYLSGRAGNSGGGRDGGPVMAVNVDTRALREVKNARGLSTPTKRCRSSRRLRRSIVTDSTHRHRPARSFRNCNGCSPARRWRTSRPTSSTR